MIIIRLYNRHLLLLLDNSSGHGTFDKGAFSNVTIEYLPPNTTSQLQPMDAGVIRNLKLHYKVSLFNSLLQLLNEINQIVMQNWYQAIKFLFEALR